MEQNKCPKQGKCEKCKSCNLCDKVKQNDPEQIEKMLENLEYETPQHIE